MIDACWNTVGIRGDGSCPELTRHVHCRNCGVYAKGAAAVLHDSAPADDLAARTARIARPPVPDVRREASAFIFRIGTEWLAVPLSTVGEVAEPRPIHAIPHRRASAIAGVANIRGALVPVVSLHTLLGADAAAMAAGAALRAVPRLLVLVRGEQRVVAPADDVHGAHRYAPADLGDVPGTLARAASRLTTHMLAWRERSVGVIDPDRLFDAIGRRSV